MKRVVGASLLALALVFSVAGSAGAADRGKVDVDVVGADVRNVLRLLADVGHVNLVVGDDVSGTVTLRLKNVPWEAALRAVLTVRGLGMERRGNLVRVSTAEAMAKERAARASAHEACLDAAPLETRLIRVLYADAEEVAALLRPTLTRRGSIVVDVRTNTVIVRDVRCE